VRSIVVIVGDVLVQQSPEVALVEHDDLVEQLSAHTAYPTFRNAVLPRAPVALAAQLKSVVLLDDQLVQSDPTRLEWFRQALRTTVRDQQHQVLVFTCRTGDYLTQDELPKPTESQHESDEGRLLSTDLEKVIRRVDRP